MGIPNYFQKILDEYPDVISIDLLLVAAAYLDFNGIVHYAAGKTASEIKYSKKNHKAYIRELLKNILKRVIQLLLRIKLTKGRFIKKKILAIYVDGSAVRAKMKQQVQRRVKGPYEHAEKERIRAELGEELEGLIYDKNSITPGTPFMQILNEYLLNELAGEFPEYEIIISDSNQPGEGEHKMFNDIKRDKLNLYIDEKNPENSEKIVIVGLDADLIMLSLVSHLDNIYLMRESTERGMKDAENIFSFVDIGFFRTMLVSDIRNQIYAIDQSTLYTKSTSNAIINDYIFMCFLLGNDFVPHSPTLSIRSGGIKRLIEHYVHVFNETKEHLVTITTNHQTGEINTKINLNPIRMLIGLLADEEDRQMFSLYRKRQKLERYPVQNRNPKGTALDDELHKLHHKPSFEVAKELKLKIDGSPGWKRKYFNHALRIKRTPENIDSVCENYLIGLDWVLQYYYTETHSWGWIYKYLSAPLFQDLYIYLSKCSEFPTEPEETKRMVPYPPLCQLMMVVPKTSSALLPPVLAKQMTDPDSVLAQYYPDEFDLNYLFHRYLWEAEPVLPLFDEKQVEMVVKSAEPSFTKEEAARNKFSITKVIPPKK